MGVVDTFGQYQFLTIKMYFMNYDMYHVLNWHKHLQIKSKAIQMKILNKRMDLFTNYSQLGKKSPSFEFQSEMSNIIIFSWNWKHNRHSMQYSEARWLLFQCNVSSDITGGSVSVCHSDQLTPLQSSALCRLWQQVQTWLQTVQHTHAVCSAHPCYKLTTRKESFQIVSKICLPQGTYEG